MPAVRLSTCRIISRSGSVPKPSHPPSHPRVSSFDPLKRDKKTNKTSSLLPKKRRLRSESSCCSADDATKSFFGKPLWWYRGGFVKWIVWIHPPGQCGRAVDYAQGEGWKRQGAEWRHHADRCSLSLFLSLSPSPSLSLTTRTRASPPLCPWDRERPPQLMLPHSGPSICCFPIIQRVAL